MSRYIVNTPLEQVEMLKSIGMNSIEELFKCIPKEVRLKKKMDLPLQMSEMDLKKHMNELSKKNTDIIQNVCFLGAGAYDHFVPSVIEQIIARQEFYTAYTPYQAEMSQGTLQAIFEYQTMICELTGMDVANASVYDGATAVAEGAVMACVATRRQEVLVAKTVNPENREVLNTYGRFRGIKVREIGYIEGKTDIKDIEKQINENTAAVIIQSPNFFGVIEEVRQIAEYAKKNKTLVIVSTDPISLAVLKSPGELGADIVVGEGQCLGNPLSFGGPYLGFFAATKKYLRQMPGRIVGETVDNKGKRGYCLTMQTREQHIRREKATSNICSNQALTALAATVYLTIMGKQGLKEVAELSLQKAHYAYTQLIKNTKLKMKINAPFFKEFVIESPVPIDGLNSELLASGIIGGYKLENDYPELTNCWLMAVTEKRTKEDIDLLVRKVGEICG